MAKYTLDVDLLSTDEATVVQVHGVRGPDTYEEVFVETGSAKRHPSDSDNPQVGRDLALARALVALADKYAERAAKAVGGSVEVGGYEYTPAAPTGFYGLLTEQLSSVAEYVQSHYSDFPNFTLS